MRRQVVDFPSQVTYELLTPPKTKLQKGSWSKVHLRPEKTILDLWGLCPGPQARAGPRARAPGPGRAPAVESRARAPHLRGVRSGRKGERGGGGRTTREDSGLKVEEGIKAKVSDVQRRLKKLVDVHPYILRACITISKGGGHCIT